MPDPADATAEAAELSEPDEAPSSKALLWTTLLCLLFVVSLAYALLLSHQVRQSEARRAAVQVQLAAFEDCLQFVRASTIASCTARLGRQSAPQAPVGNALLERAPADAPAATTNPSPMSIAVR